MSKLCQSPLQSYRDSAEISVRHLWQGQSVSSNLLWKALSTTKWTLSCLIPAVCTLKAARWSLLWRPTPALSVPEHLFWATADWIWLEQLEEPHWQRSVENLSISDDAISVIWEAGGQKLIEGTGDNLAADEKNVLCYCKHVTSSKRTAAFRNAVRNMS